VQVNIANSLRCRSRTPFDNELIANAILSGKFCKYSYGCISLLQGVPEGFPPIQQGMEDLRVKYALAITKSPRRQLGSIRNFFLSFQQLFQQLSKIILSTQHMSPKNAKLDPETKAQRRREASARYRAKYGSYIHLIQLTLRRNPHLRDSAREHMAR
jgi:hypothetical protein